MLILFHFCLCPAAGSDSVRLLSDVSESIMRSMQRSRRLLFVLSPEFLAEKSFSLLECRLGLYLQHGQRAAIVAVVYRSVSKLPCVEAARVRQAAVSTVSWRGSRSEPAQSRFWLRLRLTLPVRPLALGRRLIDSTSSHSDLAALALHRAQRIQRNHGSKLNGKQQRVLLRGRGRLKSCPQCTGFVGRVQPSRVELTVETELEQVEQPPDVLHPTPEPNVPGEQQRD